MYRRYRGIFPAILSLMCAANWASASMTQNANTDRGTGLLSTSSLVLLDPIQATLQSNNNLPWMLGDDRHLMSEPAGHVDLVSLPRLTSPSDIPTRSLPKVEPPAAATVQSTDVNELVAPIPVLSVGWAVVLFTAFFYTGSRMLRIRRSVAR